MGRARRRTLAGASGGPRGAPGAAPGGRWEIAFAFQRWIVDMHAIPSDTCPRQDVGAVFGIGGTAAGIASMGFTLLAGQIVDRFGYMPVSVMAGLLAPLAAVLFPAIRRRIERVPALVERTA